MKHLLMAFSATLILALSALAPSHAAAGQTVDYFDGDSELQGYWAEASGCPANSEKRTPTILIIHQWKGLADYERMRADMISRHCYNAFAIDIYGKGIRPDTSAKAGAQAGIYKKDPALAVRRINAALSFVRQKAGKDTPIAAIGYCFGGMMVLEYARSGASIAGIVSLHGNLSSQTPVTKPGSVKASIQIHHGADDPYVSQEEVNAFMAEMKAAKADWMLTQYADAVHAFTQKDAGDDPSAGVAYNKKADFRSWTAMLDFFDEIFANAQ